jgi:hypothetical protein
MMAQGQWTEIEAPGRSGGLEGKGSFVMAMNIWFRLR